MKYLRTSDLAKTVGVHPNTVRRYVDWGLLSPVERSPAGYRRFTQRHLDCLRLARQIYCDQYPGRAIHQSGIRIIPGCRQRRHGKRTGDCSPPPRARAVRAWPGRLRRRAARTLGLRCDR